MEKYYPIHDELIKIRNDYIAHSSDEMYEESKTFVILNPINESQFCIVYQTLKLYFLASKLMNEMVEHFENLQEQIKIKMDKLNFKLVEEYKNKRIIFKNEKKISNEGK